MACPLPPEHIKNLALFIDLCKRDPSILHYHELGFFKNFIESLGGVIPEKETQHKKNNMGGEMPQTEDGLKENDSAESDIELDFEGVIEPDNDPPQVMGSLDKEISEDDIEKADGKKREAVDLFACGKYEEAINAYTQAILSNPRAAVLYAKRGHCYLQMKKANACIRDCTKALEINPDNAAAYKFRGRAHRLLGDFLKAAEDLRMACKIDFDEQADEWLKEVTPNARKIEEHRRKHDRKKVEKELRETRERIRKMKEELEKREPEGKSGAEGEVPNGAGGAGGMPNLIRDFLEDPEVKAAFRDPEVAEAFSDAAQHPLNIFKYQNNPKVNAILQKLTSTFDGKIPAELGQMAAGLRQFAATASSARCSSSPPKTAADVDLD